MANLEVKDIPPAKPLEVTSALLPELRLTPLRLDIPDETFEREKGRFLQLRESLLDDPDYSGKYVAIVDEKIVGVGDDRIKLAREVYNKKGYVTMYIGEVSERERVAEEPSFETETTLGNGSRKLAEPDNLEMNY